MSNQSKNLGFTIVEILTVVAIIAILGALAVVGYQEYINRARAADIILKYDAIKTDVGVRLTKSKGVDDCAMLASSFDAKNLVDNYATLAYGFEATSGGYRPVLNICAKADSANPMSVKVAKGAYETMAKIKGVEEKPLISESLVSFSLPLTNAKEAVCSKNVPQPSSTCGQPQVAVPQNPAVFPGPSTCPAGRDRVLTEDSIGGKQWACFDACPSGQARSSVKQSECCANADLVDIFGNGKPECLPPCKSGQTRDSGGQCIAAQMSTQSSAQAPAPVTGQFTSRMDNKIGSAQSWLYSAGIRDSWTGRANIVSMTVDPPEMATASKADSGRWGLVFGSRTGPFTITMTLSNVPPGNETVVLKGTH